MTDLHSSAPANDELSMSMDQVDLSSLVGHEVTLYSEQYRGKPLTTKVVLVTNGILAVDRSGSGGMIDSLINNQKIVVQFVYKGQRISVDATLKRTAGGKCSLVLGEKLTPLSRRRYRRYEINRPVKCAVVSPADLDARRIARLRWIETDSINFSSGGVLLCLPRNIGNHTYLLLNIDMHDFDFPALVIGQVRYSYAIDSFRFNVGIEFIVSDLKERHFNSSTLKRLPPVVFEYDASRRAELNKELSVHMLKNTKQEQ
ncbi:MAG: hypothetical protein JSV52_15525 [Candidatus Zixiibacteriota bacterium]|nr:MAG: hypothetical protein JSV52_15525 [candidate division Zixibacteria bacterium]